MEGVGGGGGGGVVVGGDIGAEVTEGDAEVAVVVEVGEREVVVDEEGWWRRGEDDGSLEDLDLLHCSLFFLKKWCASVRSEN